MSRRVLGMWYLALGAGFTSALLVVLLHNFMTPQWGQLGVQGGMTVYPSLGGQPQAVPGSSVYVLGREFSYEHTVEAALVGAIIFVGSWLAALLLDRLEELRFPKIFGVSWLLLLPIAVEACGIWQVARMRQQVEYQLMYAPQAMQADSIAGLPPQEDSVSTAPEQ